MRISFFYVFSSCKSLCIKRFRCTFECNDVTSENVLSNFLEVVDRNCDAILLNVENIQFPKNKFSGDWLGDELLGDIFTLRVVDFKITELHSNAFNPVVFRSVRSLYLTGFQIKYLPNNCFANLKLLAILSFRNVLLKEINFEYFILNEKLENIFFENCFGLDAQITGAKDVSPSYIQILIFRYNNLGDSISSKSFIGFPKMRSLELNDNNITSLPDDVFDSIAPNVGNVNLMGNKIKNLSKHVFNPLMLHYSVKIWIMNNPWHCDENLIELKNIIVKYSGYFDKPVCETPKHLKGVKLAKFSSETTTSTTTTAGGPPNSELIAIECKNIALNTSFLYAVTKRHYRIKVITKKDGKMHIVVKTFPKHSFILWTEIRFDKLPKVECIMNRFGNQAYNEMFEIERGKSYLTCYMISGETGPANCISFNTKLEQRPKNLWISSQKQILSIVLVIITSIGCTSAGTGIIILTFRRYPDNLERFLLKIFSNGKR